MADSLGLIVRNVFRTNDFPLYSDLCNVGGTNDTRSADDIKEDIIKKLIGEKTDEHI